MSHSEHSMKIGIQRHLALAGKKNRAFNVNYQMDEELTEINFPSCIVELAGKARAAFNSE